MSINAKSNGTTVHPQQLSDGSAFAMASSRLPPNHWLYAKREYADGAEEPKELPAPILTQSERDAAAAAIRYAIRAVTMCGQESDFDPDALVQNAVYALCGPFTATGRTTLPATPVEEKPVPFGHIFRVVAGKDHPSAKRPWSKLDAAFDLGPALTDGVRNNIQYLNLYTNPSVAQTYTIKTESGELPCSLAVSAEWEKSEEYIARLEAEVVDLKQFREAVLFWRNSVIEDTYEDDPHRNQVVSESERLLNIIDHQSNVTNTSLAPTPPPLQCTVYINGVFNVIGDKMSEITLPANAGLADCVAKFKAAVEVAPWDDGIDIVADKLYLTFIYDTVKLGSEIRGSMVQFLEYLSAALENSNLRINGAAWYKSCNVMIGHSELNSALLIAIAKRIDHLCCEFENEVAALNSGADIHWVYNKKRTTLRRAYSI